MDDFRQLLAEAHSRNIKIIMDLVLNHTSDQHEWFKESRSSKDNAKRDWYIWRPPRKGKKPNNWRTNFGKSAWHFDSATGEYYNHSFFWEQPCLNWRNPEMRKAMFNIVAFWLDMGIDGFRLDVINLLFKDKKLHDESIWSLLSNKKVYSRNQPEVYRVLKEFRELLDKYPEKMSVGEIYTPPPGDSQLVASFLGNGLDMLHMAFDFSLIFTLFRSSTYYKVINRYYNYIPQQAWACFFLSNHDIGRSVKRRNFICDKYQKAKLHALLLLTLKGTPFIYYGDEIGMENASIPKHKIRDLYGKFFYPFYKGRDGARTPMQWDSTINAGFSANEPFLPVNDNYLNINVAAECEDENSVLSVYKKIISLRRQYEVLQTGEITFLKKIKRNVLAYFRHDENSRFLILLNFGFRTKRVKIKDLQDANVIFSTYQMQKVSSNSAVLLRPREGVILQIINN
jgi:alpha-glucosidase